MAAAENVTELPTVTVLLAGWVTKVTAEVEVLTTIVAVSEVVEPTEFITFAV